MHSQKVHTSAFKYTERDRQAERQRERAEGRGLEFERNIYEYKEKNSPTRKQCNSEPTLQVSVRVQSNNQDKTSAYVDITMNL